MTPAHSTRRRFTIVFVAVLFIVGLLGLFSLWRLADYHAYSSEVRDRFFQSTRLIGDLNNFTSDFRAAEATALLASDKQQTGKNDDAIRTLDKQIEVAEQNYARVQRDRDEGRLYAVFRGQWASYRAQAAQVIALAEAGGRSTATAFYFDASHHAYDAASDTLGELTALNVAKAQRAAGRADQAYSYARELTMAAVGFAILLVAGGLSYVRRSIADPLLQLSDAMLRLARGETNIDIGGARRADELGEMARALIVFRDSVIELAVSQRAAADQAALLGEKLAAEQRLTELQRNFVSMASHEFRTPLNLIDGHAQRLINTSEHGTVLDVQKRATKIRSGVLRLTSVIDNLLDASRLMDGDPSLYFHPSEFDLAGLMTEVCCFHREVAPQANLLEDYAVASQPMLGDRKLLFHALSNLLSNAIKFSTDGEPIRLTARTVAGSAVIQVADRGCGIPPDDIGHLFERYFRARNAYSIVGTGVGLYVVKTVADLHGGRVSVRSDEGRGSEFTLRLPLARAAITPAAHRPAARAERLAAP